MTAPEAGPEAGPAPEPGTARASRRDALTLALFASILAGAMIQGGLGALLPYMSQDMPMSHTLESLHVTGLAVGGGLAAAVAEAVRRRIGRGRVLLVGAVACAVGAVLLAVAPAPILSAAAMLFVGFGLTSTLIAGQVLVVTLHGRRQGARMIGELNVSYGAGALVAAAMLPFMAASVLGWRGFAAVPAVLLVVLVLPMVLAGLRRTPTEGTVAVATGAVGATGRARLAPGLMLLAVAAEWGLLFWLATHLTTVAELSTADAARATAAMWLAVLVGRILGSRILGIMAPGVLLAASLMLVVVATIALTVVTTPVAAVVTGVVAGLAAANLYAGSVAYVIEADPVHADAAVARGSLLSAVALVVAPLGVGVLADAIGLQVAYVIVSAAVIAGAFLLLVLTRPAARTTAAPTVPLSVPAAQAAPVPPEENPR